MLGEIFLLKCAIDTMINAYLSCNGVSVRNDLYTDGAGIGSLFYSNNLQWKSQKMTGRISGAGKTKLVAGEWKGVKIHESERVMQLNQPYSLSGLSISE